ncbi:MAG: triose-phosphate isomerase [Neisseriales bacterium]|nr:MAG: triose-phosphate isomerase [Neisseriales bacterium]
MSDQLLIIGNWKMHGNPVHNEQFAKVWQCVKPSQGVGVSIACPNIYLERLVHLFAGTPLTVSAQDVSCFVDEGAYTGEVSAAMLKDIGAQYVLIGHSERRRYFHEDNTTLSDKFCAAQQVGLQPIFCVGESQAERQAGCAKKVIEEQLQPICVGVDSLQTVMIAYEPVWAIGTGNLAGSEQICEVSAWIQNFVLQNIGGTASIKILYGGSVTTDNAQVILSTEGVDGILVGGASLDPEVFLQIYWIAERLVASWK